jgi:hypothetical protein
VEERQKTRSPKLAEGRSSGVIDSALAGRWTTLSVGRSKIAEHS